MAERVADIGGVNPLAGVGALQETAEYFAVPVVPGGFMRLSCA